MAAIAVHVPYGFKNLCLCKDNAGIGRKEYKGIIFSSCSLSVSNNIFPLLPPSGMRLSF